MLFSSTPFILVFLPISFFVYFWLNHRRMVFAGKAWLVAASLIFYAYWNVKYLPLILGSILFNYAIGTGLAQSFSKNSAIHASHRHEFNRKTVLLTGIVANLLLLGYYKYTDFFLANTNLAFGTTFSLPNIALPLAISFFTFTQMVYLVDSYRGETAEYDLLNYALFVTFFPHLIAGPIVHHRQIMSQFSSRWTLVKRYPNILKGLFIFGVGLFKKVVIADTFCRLGQRRIRWRPAIRFLQWVGHQPFLYLSALLRLQRLLRYGDWRLITVQYLAADQLQLALQVAGHPGFLATLAHYAQQLPA